MRPARLFLFLTVILQGPVATAGFQNRQLLPLGDREALLANTGVAGNPSSGAVYYNPAGLALIRYPSISVSSSTYLYSDAEISPIVRADNAGLTYQASGFQTIPAMVTSVWGRESFTVALSVLVPDSLKLENRQSFTTANTVTTFEQIQSTSDLWVGLSAGGYIADKLAVGLSVFGMQHQDSSALALIIKQSASPNTATVSISRTRASILNLAATLGVRWKATDYLDIGFRLQSRALRLSGKGEGYRFVQSQGGTGATIQESEQKDIKAAYPLPTDASLGVKLALSGIDVLFDLSLQEGLSYDLYPNSAFSFVESLNPTLRYNLGVEIPLTPTITLLTGGFVNPPAIHSVRGRPEGTIAQTFYGWTAGVTFVSGRVRTGIGFYYTRSLGKVVPYGSPAEEGVVVQNGAGGTIILSYFI